MGKEIHFKAQRCKKTDYIKKCFKQNSFRIKFSTKNSQVAYVYLSLEWNSGWPIFQFVECLKIN